MGYIDDVREITVQELHDIPVEKLMEVSKEITDNYHSVHKTSRRLISNEMQALVYLSLIHI